MSHSNETRNTLLKIVLGCSLVVTGVCVYAVVSNDPPGRGPQYTRVGLIACLPLVIRAAVWIGCRMAEFLRPINVRLQERHRQWEAGESDRIAAREQQRHIAMSHHQERERSRAVQMALRELDTFYAKHQSAISSEYPPSLFLARREAEITSDMTGPQAWNAVHAMMASLYPLVLEHKKHERQRLDDERTLAARRRDIERRLAKHRSNLERLKSSPLAAVALEGEIYRAQNQITELEDELSNCEADRTSNADQRQ
jgi:hypothetical protein